MSLHINNIASRSNSQKLAGETFVIDTASSTVTYKGWAKEGSSESSDVWRIARFTFSDNNNDVKQEWANGNKQYTNAWDDRAIISYS